MTIRNAILDAAMELVPHGTTKTATFTGTAVAYPLVPNHPLNDSHKCRVRAVFNVSALAAGGGTVELVLKTGSDATLAGEVVVWKQAITEVGQYEALVSLDTIAEHLDPDAKFLAGGVVITGGTAPTITFGGFATK